MLTIEPKSNYDLETFHHFIPKALKLKQYKNNWETTKLGLLWKHRGRSDLFHKK